MPTITAGDIMIPLEQYPHIPYWFSLRQAVAEMEKSELDIDGRKSLPRALLVFDEKYALLGIARRRDILKGLEPRFMQQSSPTQRKFFDVDIDDSLLDLSSDKALEKMKEMAEQPVSDCMRPIEATVNDTDSLFKVIYVLIKHDLNLVPVLRRAKVVGVVRSVDVFREVAKVIL